MMKEHRYSSEIKSIRLQTSLYDSVSQSRITRLQSELHFCAESPHDISYQLFQLTDLSCYTNHPVKFDIYMTDICSLIQT